MCSSDLATMEEMRRGNERRLARVVEELVERIVGLGKVRAEVNADLDFDRVVTNTESYDPDGQVIRSTQSVNEANDSQEAGNQSVTVANNLPDAEGGAASGRNASRGTRTEETVNYEITKTTRSHVRESGVVRRLSVAVIVDGTTTTNPDGTRTYNARTAEEMQRLTAVVRSAIGINAQRGDTLEVVNLPFASADVGDQIPQEPGLFDFAKQDLFQIGRAHV